MPEKGGQIGAAMRELGRFIESGEASHSFTNCSARCRYMLHVTCERLGLQHKSSDSAPPPPRRRRRSEITRKRSVDRILTVSRPANWSMGSRKFDAAREDLRQRRTRPKRPLGEPADAADGWSKLHECDCCGKGDDEVELALTRRWGLACVKCIDDGSMSAMVGKDVTAYKIEDVPSDYRQGAAF